MTAENPVAGIAVASDFRDPVHCLLALALVPWLEGAMLRYIELKTGYHDDGPAWIARVELSRSGQTLYFDGKALKRGGGGPGNYYDLETGERYWVSGVKKRGGDRHWAGSGEITIEARAVAEYLKLVGEQELDRRRFVVSDAIAPPDSAKFHELENKPL